MKKIVSILLVAFCVSVQAQDPRIVIVEKEVLEPIVTGEHKNKLVTPNSEPVESRINYAYFGFSEGIKYQELANKIIYDYVHDVAIDTAYIPVSENLSLQFFKDAVNNFFESYNYVRFRLNVDDLPPYWMEMNLDIDTTTFKNYVQLSLETTIFTGGAHPYILHKYVLIDKQRAEVVSWDKLIANKAQFCTISEKYFRKADNMQKEQNYKKYFFESGQFELAKNFTFTKRAMHLIYLPYEAREWARGTINVKIPKRKIKKLLHFNW